MVLTSTSCFRWWSTRVRPTGVITTPISNLLPRTNGIPSTIKTSKESPPKTSTRPSEGPAEWGMYEKMLCRVPTWMQLASLHPRWLIHAIIMMMNGYWLKLTLGPSVSAHHRISLRVETVWNRRVHVSNNTSFLVKFIVSPSLYDQYMTIFKF